ncbi:unnamed protein product [Rhizoctonia solani]|uniref:Uncharacterized protein n=1 Tax=Rhizoctonia solani TaxID=456999 RepID=A0A8H3HQI2_9AGAM|nr:unnamed protein product [Rhizoctonia solani]
MADFFTSTLVAPVDNAVAQKAQTGSTSGVTNQSTETAQAKSSAGGSNFSMCEIIIRVSELLFIPQHMQWSDPVNTE